MPVYYVYGTGFRELKKGREEVRLFKGPMYEESTARKRGYQIFGEDFDIFVSNSEDYNVSKSHWKSQQLDKTGNISDSIQPLYNVKE